MQGARRDELLAGLAEAARGQAEFLRERLRGLGVPEDRVQDAMQDVLEVLVRRLDAYDDRFSFRQWMAGVARRVARRHRELGTRRPSALLGEPIDEDRESPEQWARRLEAVEVLRDFLAGLDEDRWTVFVLSEIEGLRGSEIAAEQAIPISTVYARLRSARKDFERAVARHRAREERRFVWFIPLGVFRPTPATSLAAVSVHKLLLLAVLAIAFLLGAWTLSGRTDVQGHRVSTAVDDTEDSSSKRSDPPDPFVPVAPESSPERREPNRIIAAASVEDGAEGHEGDVRHEAIDGFAELYRDWSDERFHDLFAVDAPAWMLEEQLEWFRSVLGPCESPEPLVMAEPDRGRFVFRCETGELEVGFLLEDADTGRIARLRSGARGVEPPPAVRTAAETALALRRQWNDELFARSFTDTFDPVELRAFLAENYEQWGDCTLQGVDLARHRGALFDLQCTVGGDRLLKIDLAEDDRIAILVLHAARPTKIREG